MTEEIVRTKPKKPWYKKWWVWAIVVVVIAALGSGGDKTEKKPTPSPSVAAAVAQNTNAQKPTEAPTLKPTPEPTPKPTPSTIKYEAELTSGHYIAGIDFPAGKYDIDPIKGKGNVSSTNMFNGGINAMMGDAAAQAESDLFDGAYSNISLTEGVTLSISGLTVKISSEKASSDPLKPRNQDITDVITLSNGNFVAGEDFPAGVYTIVTTKGSGNISSNNMFEGGINAMMAAPDKTSISDLFETEYKNISLTDGVTLTISGITVEMTPSK